MSLFKRRPPLMKLTKFSRFPQVGPRTEDRGPRTEVCCSTGNWKNVEFFQYTTFKGQKDSFHYQKFVSYTPFLVRTFVFEVKRLLLQSQNTSYLWNWGPRLPVQTFSSSVLGPDFVNLIQCCVFFIKFFQQFFEVEWRCNLCFDFVTTVVWLQKQLFRLQKVCN